MITDAIFFTNNTGLKIQVISYWINASEFCHMPVEKEIGILPVDFWNINKR